MHCNILCVTGVKGTFVHCKLNYNIICVPYMCSSEGILLCLNVGEWISGAVCQGLVEFLVNQSTRRGALVSVGVVLVSVVCIYSTPVCKVKGA